MDWKESFKPVTDMARQGWGTAKAYGRLADESLAHGFGRAYKAPRAVGRWAFSGRHHEAGMKWAKDMIRPAPKTAGMGMLGKAARWLGPAWTAYDALQGFQEGGIAGAAKSVANSLSSAYLFGRVASTLVGPVGIGIATGVATAGLISSFAGGPNVIQGLSRPYVRDYAKRHAKLELATPVVDSFGTVATMRQRSVMAIQNSRINGRSALGNEAVMGWKPYAR